MTAIPALLIESARGGSEVDIDRFLEAAWPHAYRIALSILHDTALAEDAAQEACAIVYRAIVGLRSSEAFSVWFYRIVVREALAISRRRAPLLAAVQIASPFDLAEAVLRIDVRNALLQLTPVQRAALSLHIYAGLNSREIATILRIPDSSVRFHIIKARRVLEVLLSEHASRRSLRSEVPHGAA